MANIYLYADNAIILFNGSFSDEIQNTINITTETMSMWLFDHSLFLNTENAYNNNSYLSQVNVCNSQCNNKRHPNP